MGTIQTIISDLGNGLSGLDRVFDKILESAAFASSKLDYEEIIQSGDCLHFFDQQKIIAFWDAIFQLPVDKNASIWLKLLLRNCWKTKRQFN